MTILFALMALAGGLFTGAALAAFFMLLDLIPRLVQLGGGGQIKRYQWILTLGAFTGAILSVYRPYGMGQDLLAIPLGFFLGAFVGMVAAALAEVLNALPILSKRVGMEREVRFLLWALIGGKVVGALIYWSYPSLW